MKAKLYTDGGSRGNPGSSACSCVLLSENDQLLAFDAKYLGIGTNNNAEYNGLLLGIKLAIKNNISELECILDSELIVKQLNREYKIKDANIQNIATIIFGLNKSFKVITFRHVAREFNKHADKLVNLMLDAHLV